TSLLEGKYHVLPGGIRHAQPALPSQERHVISSKDRRCHGEIGDREDERATAKSRPCAAARATRPDGRRFLGQDADDAVAGTKYHGATLSLSFHLQDCLQETTFLLRLDRGKNDLLQPRHAVGMENKITHV